MREILFRGKRIDNGEWVIGNFYESQISGCYILENKLLATVGGRHSRATIGYKLIPYEVDPETVGQYTGLKDKNGKRIFEGDIIRWLPAFEEKTDVVSFDEAGFCAGEYFLQSALYYGDFDGEIIGNTHDNLEFMKEGVD